MRQQEISQVIYLALRVSEPVLSVVDRSWEPEVTSRILLGELQTGLLDIHSENVASPERLGGGHSEKTDGSSAEDLSGSSVRSGLARQ